jgi:hypothetical protein
MYFLLFDTVSLCLELINIYIIQVCDSKNDDFDTSDKLITRRKGQLTLVKDEIKFNEDLCGKSCIPV